MPDKKKFEKFYEEHLDKVYRFIFFRCGNKDLAEDLVSEIFMKALEHFDNYDEKKSSSAWIMTIARNHLINYWRDKKPTQPLPGETPEDSDDAYDDAFWLKSARLAFNKDKEAQEIYELLATLSKEEAELVTFHYLIGYSYLEIAKQKQMSEGSVKVAVHRAIKKLRKNYETN